MAVIMKKKLKSGVTIEIDDADYIQKSKEVVEYEREWARRLARSIMKEQAGLHTT